MNGRFLNLVVNHMSGGVPFSIHRINPANLFYPAGSPVLAQGTSPSTDATATMEDVPLPPATICFDWPRPPEQDCSMDFMAFGSKRDKIIAVDSTGETCLYDAAVRSIRFSSNMPMMLPRVMKPMSAAVGDHGLFVMSGIDHHQFVALMDGRDRNYCMPNWRWQSLRPPPFPVRRPKQQWFPFEIGAYTAVGDQFWVSTVGAGTFGFNAESGAWRKIQHWALPFRGRAEYVPEQRLWIGFSDRGGQEELCASDLALAAVSAPVARTPAWQNLVSDMGLRLWPKDWELTSTHLLPLGSGRLCTARFFLTKDEDDYRHDTRNNLMVLAGVEVVSDEEGRVRMIRHKSQRYTFGRERAVPM